MRIVLSILISFFLTIFPTTSSYSAENGGFSATLADFEGEVYLQKTGEDVWLPVEKDIPLEQGDKIKTEANSSAEILIDDGSLVELDEKSEMTLEELSAKYEIKKIAATIYLKFGRLLSNIVQFMHKSSKYNVRTQTTVAGVRGTEFVVETTDSTLTDVGVFGGEVVVGGVDAEGNLLKETEIILKKGHQTKVRRNRKPMSPFVLEKRMLAHQKN